MSQKPRLFARGLLVAALGVLLVVEPREAGAAPGDGDAPASTEAASDKPAEAGAPDSQAEATALFTSGKELLAKGHVEAACQKFEQSLQKKPGVGTEFNLADCWDRLGKTASAYELFLKVEATTQELGQNERSALAHGRALALERRLTRVRLKLSTPAEGLELRRDGQAIPKEKWEESALLDPGEHRLEASAPGKEAWSTTVSLSTKEPGTTVIEVPPLKDATVVPAVVVAKTEPEPTAPPKPDRGRAIATIGLAGFGAAALLTGLAMGEQYVASQQDAKAICPSSHHCTEGEVALHDTLVSDAQTARTWAYVGIGVGSAAILGATYLFFTSPERQRQPANARLRAEPIVTAGGGSFGAGLRGKF